jgi:cysteine desulfurase / selenocysteine lyase
VIPIDVEAIRREFSIFAQPIVYLDSAATCQKPDSVIQTITNYLSHSCGTVHRAVYPLAMQATEQYDQARKMCQRFIGAQDASEVVFTKGTTEGINLVAFSFGEAFLEPGDEVLLPETEHHSNIVPWQRLCEKKGAYLRVIPVDDRGEICLDVYRGMLSSRVKIVATAHIANATGVIHPIAEMIALAHGVGAKVLVDGAQSFSHMPIDVQALDADFFVASSHKAYGPTGAGLLYGKKALLDTMPPFLGGGDMIKTVSFEKTTYQDSPLKFEAGTPAIAEVLGFSSAIQWMQSQGLDRLHMWEQMLTEEALERLRKIPSVQLLSEPKNRGSIITFTCKGCHPLDVGTLLGSKGICVRTGHLCAQPALKRFGASSAIRISFAAYNTRQDVDLFIRELERILQILA